MDTGHLYVVRAPSGLRKIGFTAQIDARMRSIPLDNILKERGEFILEFSRECRADLMRIAERHAHLAAWGLRETSEWFRIDLDEAVRAVEFGISAAERGVPMVKRPGCSDQKVSVTFTSDEVEAIEDVWHEDRHRSRNETIRELVRLGIKAWSGGADEKP